MISGTCEPRLFSGVYSFSTVCSVLMWVPANWVAAGLTGLPDTDIEIVALGRDMGQTGALGDVTVPASVADVEFYVPSFFASPAGSAVLSQMPRLKVVQTLTAGVDWLRPHLPPGVAVLDRMPRLKVVQTLTAGVDWLRPHLPPGVALDRKSVV